MFFYFYDIFVSSKKSEGLLSQVENRLIELGINGRIEKFSLLKNMKEMLEDGIKKGAHTIIIVGDDHTFTKVLNIVANYDVVLGFVPFIPDSKLATYFGIPYGAAACDVLSKRLIKKVDLGKVNQTWFLSQVELPTNCAFKINCNDQYTLSTVNPRSKITINNLGAVWKKSADQLFSIQDGYLNVMIETQEKNRLKLWSKQAQEKNSIFPIRKATIESTDHESCTIVDQDLKLKMPLQITIKPKKLKIIVGKERTMAK